MTYTVILLQEVQVGNLVAAQVVDDVLLAQEFGDLARLVLELLEAREDLLALLLELGGGLFGTIKLHLQAADEIDHVGGLEQLILGSGELEGLGIIVFGDLVVGELEEREDEVSVEVSDQLGHQIVFSHDDGIAGRG
jgi:hypothetical protein